MTSVRCVSLGVVLSLCSGSLAACSGVARPSSACSPCSPCAPAAPEPTPSCRDWYAGGALAYGPDIGLAAEAGRIFDRDPSATWSVEGRATYEFVDNTEFLSAGSGLAPPRWKQLELGVKVALAPEAAHHLTGRLGLVLADVQGNLNRVRDVGTYYGACAGIGFETELPSGVTIGPSVSGLLLEHEGGGSPYVVPQLDWHVTWALGGGSCCAADREDPCDYVAHREFYAGASATALPGLGASAELGQAFLHRPYATWSFEMQATKQTLDGVFGGRDPGADCAQLLIGVKASFTPERRGHLVGRLGFCALRATGTNDYLDVATTYYGAYAGLGYEWDLSDRWTTGPDVKALVGLREGEGTVEVIPQVGWHLIRWL
jgi:hypothetical protein